MNETTIKRLIHWAEHQVSGELCAGRGAPVRRGTAEHYLRHVREPVALPASAEEVDEAVRRLRKMGY